jgi:hypothetical protein
MLVGEMEILEADEHDEAARDSRQVADGIQLPKSVPGTTISRQLHTNGRGDGHEEVITHAENEQEYHHEGVAGGRKADEEDADTCQQQGSASEASAAEKPQGG